MDYCHFVITVMDFDGFMLSEMSDKKDKIHFIQPIRFIYILVPASNVIETIDRYIDFDILRLLNLYSKAIQRRT